MGLNYKHHKVIIAISFLLFIIAVVTIGMFAYFTTPEKTEKECFRSLEWFPTATEALNWSLNEAPARVESFSQFIYYDYGIIVTRHEIIVEPTKRYSFGYDVVIIFYGE